MDNKLLKRVGLKVTLPRVKILQILAQAAGKHLRAEDVYRCLVESGDDVGLATVYRVLTQFEAAGLVRKHNFEGDYAVFELEEGSHHDHLVCNRCNRVEEFLDEVIEERQRQIATKMGYQISDHSLTIYGICSLCSQTG